LSELVIEVNGDYSNIPKLDAEQHVGDGRLVANRLFHLRVPTIGIVHGFCLGGGAEFYTLCDVLYGASGSKEEGGLIYGFPEPTIGVMAGGWARSFFPSASVQVSRRHPLFRTDD